MALVLDASVVIGFLNAQDAHHGAAVSAFAANRSEQLVLPASVYAEVLVGPYRHGASAVEKVEKFVAGMAMRIEPISAEIARQAASLRARHRGLKLPDALVIATGEAIDARILTADGSWPGISRRAELI